MRKSKGFSISIVDGVEVETPSDVLEQMAVDREIVDDASRDAAVQKMRNERARRLAESDWVMLPDAKVKNLEKWARYRQALRDLPSKTPDPFNVAWPVPPQD